MSEQQQAQQSGQFALQRIYVKDLSFEAPGTPKAFTQPWKPEVNIEIGTGANRAEDGKTFEVVLTVTVTVKNENATAFIAEVKQAGLFYIDGVPDNQLGHVLGAFCPNVLFPYARETISDVVTRGSFPQLLLAPMNFDAVFEDAQRKRQAEVAPGSVQ
ncbi:MAG: preprotein translocase subunit SecB [Moraxellaceae bacterium]|jgi:preprotein translocase subunit SecB|nr:preprotein translocase subunit SecB [Moraxellaceae bacterium]